MANEKRLIDFEQAMRATYEEIFWTESEQAVVRHFLAKLPRADAVEVVRCEGCEYRHDLCFAGKGNTYCDLHHKYFPLDGFCNYGKTRRLRDSRKY